MGHIIIPVPSIWSLIEVYKIQYIITQISIDDIHHNRVFFLNRIIYQIGINAHIAFASIIYKFEVSARIVW